MAEQKNNPGNRPMMPGNRPGSKPGNKPGGMKPKFNSYWIIGVILAGHDRPAVHQLREWPEGD